MGTFIPFLVTFWLAAVVAADTGDVGDTGDTGGPGVFVDIDCNGTNDADQATVDRDGDADGDGVSNGVEADECETDPCSADVDADNDGLSNTDEAGYGTDPCDPGDPDQTLDEDCDGAPDYSDDEIAFDDEADNDSDGVTNGEELGACGSDPCVPNRDPDGDGVPTTTELACGANPCSPDSDNDGIWDGDELAGASDCGPDSDGDGAPDIIDRDNGEQHGAADDVLDPERGQYGLEGGAFTGGACHTGGAAAAWLPLLLCLGAVLARRRSGVAVIALMMVLPARAQELDVQRFRPSVDGRDFVIVDDPEVGANGPGGHVLTNYARDPFLYRFPDSGAPSVPVLQNLWTLDLLAHYNLQPVMFGIAAPLHLVADGLTTATAGPHILGDLDLDAKVVLLDPAARPVGLGFSSRLGLPTGNGRAWVGQPGVTGTGQLNLSYGRAVVLAANFGIHVAKRTDLDDIAWGTAALWRTGVSIPLHELIWLSTEIDAAHQLGSLGATGANPMEALFSARVAPWASLVGTLGGGTGLSRGIGAPAYRFFFGVGWVPAAERPTTTPPPPPPPPPPSTATLAFEVTDIEGNPLVATITLVEQDLRVSTDEAGVASTELPPGHHAVVTHAPGFSSTHQEVSIAAGEQRNLNVVLTRPRVVVTERQIVIRDKIFFEFDSATIKPESFGLLDELVVTMLDHLDLTLVEIQGHSDDQGTDEYNQQLSQTRAEAVMLYMVQHEVDAQRLLARGYGESLPLKNEDSDEARAINRRVEFHIIERR